MALALDALHRTGAASGALCPQTVRLDGDVPTLAVVDVDGDGTALACPKVYLAPELQAGGWPDSRSDLFALGGLVHEMATGRRPFEQTEGADLAAAMRAGRFTRLDQHDPMAPPSLSRIVAICLAPDPDDRWQSARDFGRELGAAGAFDEPAPERLEDDSRASPATLYGVNGLVAGIVVSGAWRAFG